MLFLFATVIKVKEHGANLDVRRDFNGAKLRTKNKTKKLVRHNECNVKQKVLFHYLLCGGALTINTHTLQCICTHKLYFTHCEWGVHIHICACMCKHIQTNNLGW